MNRRYGVCLIGLLAGAAAPALAQPVLHLSATGSVQASPDLLVADLLAQATSAGAAAAQRRVNAQMAEGMAAAQAAAGFDARALGYGVMPADERHNTWTAQQTLELRGADAPALLDIVGKLQEAGFVVRALDWQLSPAARRRAHDAATVAALRELQARAAMAAETLGLHIDRLLDVRLDSPGFVPRPMTAMLSRTLSAPPPQASAAPEAVEATVSADIALR